jgi:molybdate transport system substrate-binding protein
MIALLPEPVAAEEPVQIYAAATFRAGLDAVLAAYADTGGQARAVYAPTPVLVQQIEQGAPADIFFSADPGWMDEAAKRHLIRPETRADIMANDLVLIGPPTNTPARQLDTEYPIDSILARGRIAMCDPQRDPAGRYARISLEHLGMWSRVKDDIAIAENTLGAVVLVDRGEAAAAVVFATDMRGAAQVSVIGRFPDSAHPPIVYPAALTQTAAGEGPARLLAFLRSPPAAAVLLSYGYRPRPA